MAFVLDDIQKLKVKRLRQLYENLFSKVTKVS